MKTFIYSCFLILTISCSRTNEEVVKEFITARNNYDKEKISQLITDDFSYTKGKDSINRQYFLSIVDSNRISGNKIFLDTSFIVNLTLKTIEPYMDRIDSLLHVEKLIKSHKSYIIIDNKIRKIIIDSITNQKENDLDREMRYNAVSIYIEESYPDLSYDEVKSNAIKYIKEFNKLDQNTKSEYLKFGKLKGLYYCSNPSFYDKIEIVGRSSAYIYYNMVVRLKIAASYIIDGNYIRVESEHGKMLFKIGNDGNLYGEGLSKGKFEKIN